MDRRTYEGPMDWEYQDSGPFDPTSPFTHAVKSNSQNGKLRLYRIANPLNGVKSSFSSGSS